MSISGYSVCLNDALIHKLIVNSKEPFTLTNRLFLISFLFFSDMKIVKSRGNNVLGINDSQNGDDNLPYATINYANGPGHRVNMNLGGRQNLNKLHMEDNVCILVNFDSLFRVYFGIFLVCQILFGFLLFCLVLAYPEVVFRFAKNWPKSKLY